jgi:hypothetical protein
MQHMLQQLYCVSAAAAVALQVADDVINTTTAHATAAERQSAYEPQGINYDYASWGLTAAEPEADAWGSSFRRASSAIKTRSSSVNYSANHIATVGMSTAGGFGGINIWDLETGQVSRCHAE